MKFDNIKSEICELINGRYELEKYGKFENELLSLKDECLKCIGILRIKRRGIKVDKWKTIVLIDIEATGSNTIKVELKKAISWLAYIKESLLGTESTDLYLFLVI